RLHHEVHRAVAAEAQAPDLAVVVSRLVVEHARAAAAEDLQPDLPDVFFEAATADASEQPAPLVDEEAGPGTPVGRALDAGDDGEGGGAALPRAAQHSIEDLPELLPVLHAQTPATAASRSLTVSRRRDQGRMITRVRCSHTHRDAASIRSGGCAAESPRRRLEGRRPAGRAVGASVDAPHAAVAQEDLVVLGEAVLLLDLDLFAVPPRAVSPLDHGVDEPLMVDVQVPVVDHRVV